MDTETRADVLRRIAYARGHLDGIRRMIEDENYCVDVMKQSYAVRRALEKAEARMLDGHLHHCVVDAIEIGKPEPVLAELVELYELVHR